MIANKVFYAVVCKICRHVEIRFDTQDKIGSGKVAYCELCKSVYTRIQEVKIPYLYARIATPENINPQTKMESVQIDFEHECSLDYTYAEARSIGKSMDLDIMLCVDRIQDGHNDK